MTAQLTINHATSRPWRVVPSMPERIGGTDLKQGHIAHVYAKGEPYLCDGGIKYPTDEQTANAKLIVSAVNNYDAYRALAEAARIAIHAYNEDMSPYDAMEALANLENALKALEETENA